MAVFIPVSWEVLEKSEQTLYAHNTVKGWVLSMRKGSPDSRSFSPSKMSSEAIHGKCQSGKQVQADLLLWARCSAALKLSNVSSSYSSAKNGRKNRGMERSFCREPRVFCNLGLDTCSVQSAGKGLYLPQPALSSPGWRCSAQLCRSWKCVFETETLLILLSWKSSLLSISWKGTRPWASVYKGEEHSHWWRHCAFFTDIVFLISN